MKKVAFITGGTGGLGLTIVQDLLERGYEVISISRDAARIEEAASPDQTCGIWMCCEYLFHRF